MVTMVVPAMPSSSSAGEVCDRTSPPPPPPHHFFLALSTETIGLLIAGEKIRCIGNKGENGCNSRVHREHITVVLLRWRRKEKLADYFTSSALAFFLQSPSHKALSISNDVALLAAAAAAAPLGYGQGMVRHALRIPLVLATRVWYHGP